MDACEPESDLEIFGRQVRARSAELSEAMDLVTARGLSRVLMGLLRQELESMVRVLFLLAQEDRELRSLLISAAVAGEQWRIPNARGKRQKVHDAEIVAAADRHASFTCRTCTTTWRGTLSLPFHWRIAKSSLIT
jgi:hypothetical protein